MHIAKSKSECGHIVPYVVRYSTAHNPEKWLRELFGLGFSSCLYWILSHALLALQSDNCPEQGLKNLIHFTLKVLRLLSRWRCRPIFLSMEYLDIIRHHLDTDTRRQRGLWIITQEKNATYLKWSCTPGITKEVSIIERGRWVNYYVTHHQEWKKWSQYSQVGWGYELISIYCPLVPTGIV